MTESERTASRVVLVSGLAGAVLLLGALGVLGDLPDRHCGPAVVASYFIVHRPSVFVSLALAGVAFAQRGYLYPDVRQQVVGQLFVLWVIGSAVICSRRAVCCKVGR